MLTLSFAWSQTQIPIPSTSTAPSCYRYSSTSISYSNRSCSPCGGRAPCVRPVPVSGYQGRSLPDAIQAGARRGSSQGRGRCPSAYEGSMAPDGHRFAFINGEGAWIYEVTTEQVTPIHLGEDGKLIQWDSCSSPVWSPGGSRFLAAQQRERFGHSVLVGSHPLSRHGQDRPWNGGMYGTDVFAKRYLFCS